MAQIPMPKAEEVIKTDTVSGNTSAEGGYQTLTSAIVATDKNIISARAIANGSGYPVCIYVGGGGTYKFWIPLLTSSANVTVTYYYY